jgi:hypothetical protein
LSLSSVASRLIIHYDSEGTKGTFDLRVGGQNGGAYGVGAHPGIHHRGVWTAKVQAPNGRLVYKTALTFSDAIAAVCREIWLHQISFMSRPRRDSIEIPRHIWNRVEDALAYAA